MKIVIEYERSVTLIHLDYLVYDFNNCVDNTSTKIGLTSLLPADLERPLLLPIQIKGDFFS